MAPILDSEHKKALLLHLITTEVLEVDSDFNEHSIFGMLPIAEIVSALQLTSLCKRELAKYKVSVEIRFVESIPRTSTRRSKRGTSPS